MANKRQLATLNGEVRKFDFPRTVTTWILIQEKITKDIIVGSLR